MRARKIILIPAAETYEDVGYGITDIGNKNLTKIGIDNALLSGKILKAILGFGKIHIALSKDIPVMHTYNLMIPYFTSSNNFKITGTTTAPSTSGEEWERFFATKQLNHYDSTQRKNMLLSTMEAYMHATLRFMDDDPMLLAMIIIVSKIAVKAFLAAFCRWSTDEFDQIRNPEPCELIMLIQRNYQNFVLESDFSSQRSIFMLS